MRASCLDSTLGTEAEKPLLLGLCQENEWISRRESLLQQKRGGKLVLNLVQIFFGGGWAVENGGEMHRIGRKRQESR
jgi:hypothetical protein